MSLNRDFLIADFPLDAQRPPIADPPQRLDEQRNVDLPLAQGNFLAPGAGHGRPVGIFDAHLDTWKRTPTSSMAIC